jgi:hypothetical protein
MIDELLTNFQCVNRYWSRVTTGLLRGQWAWVDAGFRTADKLLGAAEGPAPAGDLGALVRCALDRVQKGLPPPRELYDVKYREQIDWLRFPAWTRPSDPEAFTGCAHEG